MATATLELNRPLETQPAAALPVWWRQRHTYVLAAMAAVQVVGCRWSVLLIDGSTWAGEIIVGVLLAQSFLLGLWAALGGLGTLPRWGIIGTIHLAGVVSMSLGMRIFGASLWWAEALQIGLIGAMLVLGFAACLLPLRGLAGWRVDFDAAVYRDVRGRRGQVSFMDLAGYSLGVGAALAAARLTVQAEIIDTEGLLILCTWLSLVLLTGSGVAYALLTWRRLGLALAASVVWPLVIAGGNSLLAEYIEDLDVFGGSANPAVLGVRLHMVSFYGGVALLVATTLTLLRLFGLKLIVVPLPVEQASSLVHSQATEFTPAKAA
ncbi:MAG TPA: hypothetical protein VFB80_22080 [Pirellulaceae bacterium]|nr:hypothetical protein [Pirellulaceae bacterium]